MSKKDLPQLVLLALLVTAGVQFIRYHVLIDSVEKTVAAQVAVWHQSGEAAFRESLLEELELMGLAISAEDLVTEGRVLEDELFVELSYDWPFELLLWDFPREQSCELIAPYYQL